MSAPRTVTYDAAAVPADCSPEQAQVDVESYISDILPELDIPDMTDLSEEEDEAHEDPIPGHFHFLDPGFW